MLVLRVVVRPEVEYDVLVLRVPVEVLVDDVDRSHSLNGSRPLFPIGLIGLTKIWSILSGFELVEQEVDSAPQSDLGASRHVLVERVEHPEEDLVVRVDPILLLVEVGEQVHALEPRAEVLERRQTVLLETCKITGIFEQLDGGCLELVESVFGAMLAQASTFQINYLLKENSVLR